MSDRRLEFGCGPSPRDGYEHSDVNPGPHIEHVGPIQDLDFPDGTFVEIFGTGALEHLTYEQAAKFLRKAIRWLTPGGLLYVDVPDMSGWLLDLIQQNRSKSSVACAINGWCRFPGDEHKSYWTLDLIVTALVAAGYSEIDAQRRSDRCGGPSRNDWHVCATAKRPHGDLPQVVHPNAAADGWESDR